MAKQTSGKILLRNVIRHTDAHNKIQEETEMWKMRDWEIQTSHPRNVSGMENERRRMYCDRVPYQPRYLNQSRMSEHDDREARYWTRKLYEFESNDPDRWGHSGFKELYPEEFQSDSEESPASKIRHHKTKKSKSEAASSKQSKKSSRKKKKKKKKKSEGEKRKKVESSSSGDDSGATKDRERVKKRKSKNHKYAKIRRDVESSFEECSDDEKEKGGRTSNHKRRKQASHGDSDSGLNVKKKKRRNWKAADEGSSCDSSAD